VHDAQHTGRHVVGDELGLDDLGGSRSQSLKDVVERIGRDRLILSRCDSPDAAKAGAELGITMYQGRLIDKQVQEAAAAKAAPAKVAVAS